MASNWLDDYFGPGSVQEESTDLPKRPILAFIGPGEGHPARVQRQRGQPDDRRDGDQDDPDDDQ